MNIDKERVLLRAVKVRGFEKNAFDLDTIGGCPPHHFSAGQFETFQLSTVIRNLLPAARHDLRQSALGRADVSEVLSAERGAELRIDSLGRAGHGRDCFRCWIKKEEVREGALQSAEVDPGRVHETRSAFSSNEPVRISACPPVTGTRAIRQFE